MSKGKLSEAQRRGLEFLAAGPWVAVWWGGKPHGSWPKALNARAYDNLAARGLIGWKSDGRFTRTVAITPAGRAALIPTPETGRIQRDT